jgi:hypothetical protein
LELVAFVGSAAADADAASFVLVALAVAVSGAARLGLTQLVAGVV